MKNEKYSLIVVGTGFASTFFLREFLAHASPRERILVLERGRKTPQYLRLERRSVADVDFDTTIVNRTPNKDWVQNIAFGGGACWTGNTPRMHPNDFRTRSLYGVGEDWPLTYDDLEPFYVRAETAMAIAGAAGGPYRRSAPYPYRAHRLNALDELLAKAYPEQHLPFPSARSSDVACGRAVCCASGVCSICPISSKFQVDLHMSQPYDDPRVTLLLEAEVERVELKGGVATGVHYKQGGKEAFAGADLVAVGAHAIMTPFILLRSGLSDPALGRYLNEQISRDVQINLNGVENFGGGQAVSGMGIMFLDGEFRKAYPGALIESWNVPWLRAEYGRWRQRAVLKFVFEDIPSAENYVGISKESPDKPEIYYPKYSDYMEKGLAQVSRMVDELARVIPVESYYVLPEDDLGGSAHIQGTTRMGTDPATSVVDRDLRHHRFRNLMVLGGGAFPTCPAANPTLTLSALSIRAAERLFS